MSVFKVKVVGLSFNKVESPVNESDYVILRADPSNEFDSEAVAVFNDNHELIGHVANSERTLSPNNRKNGNISASELKGNIDFAGKEFYGEVIKAFSSCLYLEVNEGKWSYTNKPVEDIPEITFKRAIDLETDTAPSNDVDTLKEEVQHLKAIVAELQKVVVDLKSMRMGGK